MVYVRLEREWTDGNGKTHPAGSTVDVDPATLAKLEADGVVAESVNPDGGQVNPDSWIGITGTPDGEKA